MKRNALNKLMAFTDLRPGDLYTTTYMTSLLRILLSMDVEKGRPGKPLMTLRLISLVVGPLDYGIRPRRTYGRILTHNHDVYPNEPDAVRLLGRLR